MQALDDISKPA